MRFTREGRMSGIDRRYDGGGKERSNNLRKGPHIYPVGGWVEIPRPRSKVTDKRHRCLSFTRCRKSSVMCKRKLWTGLAREPV
jgi:hypothetical protein